MLKITVLAVFHIAGVLSCSSRVTPTKHFKHDIASEYSLDPPPSRACTIRRSETPAYHFNDNKEPECGNVPGLSKLQHGVSRSHYSSNSREISPTHAKVFSFSCYDSLGSGLLRFKNLTAPSEVAILEPRTRVTYEKQIISAPSLLKAFLEDINLRKPENSFILHLAELGLNFDQYLRSAAYIAMTVDTFYVKLSGNLRPTTSIQSDFMKLPLQLEGNYAQYAKFVFLYGTHIIYESSYGGQLLILVSHRRVEENVAMLDVMKPSTVESLINEVLLLERGQKTKVSVFTQGGMPDKHNDVNAWLSTVREEPIPLYSKFMPIHELLEKDNVTLRSKNMKNMIQFEQQLHALKRTVFEIQSLQPKTTLAKFVAKVFHDELDQVCVSPGIFDNVYNDMLRYSNIQFNKFSINCSLRWYDGVEKVNMVSVRMFYLVPGVCLSFTVPVKTRCDEITYSLPVDADCAIFFTQPGCNHHSQKYHVKTAQEMNDYFSVTKSMRLCTYQERQ